MSDKEATTEATTEAKDPLVKVDREKYQTVKSASGGNSLNNGDIVATGLQGLETDETYEVAGKFLTFPITVSKVKIVNIDEARDAYSGLNDGMQRMNLGNRIRGQIAKINKANEKAIADAVKAEKPEPKTVSGEDKLAKILSPYTKARDKREAEAQKAKDAKAEEAQAKKDAEAKKAEAQKAKDAEAEAEAKVKKAANS